MKLLCIYLMAQSRMGRIVSANWVSGGVVAKKLRVKAKFSMGLLGLAKRYMGFVKKVYICTCFKNEIPTHILLPSNYRQWYIDICRHIFGILILLPSKNQSMYTIYTNRHTRVIILFIDPTFIKYWDRLIRLCHVSIFSLLLEWTACEL